jgi:hypothetical protein
MKATMQETVVTEVLVDSRPGRKTRQFGIQTKTSGFPEFSRNSRAATQAIGAKI